MDEKVRHIIQRVCDIIELCIAAAVGVGLAVSLLLFIPEAVGILTSTADASSFLMFLEELFSFIVGVEFIKMLLHPNAENVIEVLVFLVARHMILESNSSSDLLLSVISVILLYGCRLVLHRYRMHFRDSDM